jgi:hypothetical protein
VPEGFLSLAHVEIPSLLPSMILLMRLEILLGLCVGNFAKRILSLLVLAAVPEFVYPIIFKSNSVVSAMVGEDADLK